MADPAAKQGMSKRHSDPDTDRPPDPGPDPGRERDLKAEIIDRLYDVALDPIRLGELLEVWEDRMAPLRDSGLPGAQADDPGLEAHLIRASAFLDRYEPVEVPPGYRAILDDIPKSAAFVSDGGPMITAHNRAASIAFGLDHGAAFADLPFDPEDIETLRSVVRQVAAGAGAGASGGKLTSLRLRSAVSGGPVIVRVSPVQDSANRSLALVLSTELVWPQG